METVEIKTEFIKLGQVLKLAGLVDNGGFAKEVISNGLVKVNDETETRRGRKLFGGEIIFFNDRQIKVIRNVH